MVKRISRSSYASRGLKMRFTSGSGSEVRWVTRKANQCFISRLDAFTYQSRRRSGSAEWFGKLHRCSSAVPSGIRAVLAENLICSSLIWNAPPVMTRPLPTRICAVRTFPDAISARYRLYLFRFFRVPNYDNMFAGSNEDAEDFDDTTSFSVT